MLSYILIFCAGGATIYTESKTQEKFHIIHDKIYDPPIPKASGYPGGFWFFQEKYQRQALKKC